MLDVLAPEECGCLTESLFGGYLLPESRQIAKVFVVKCSVQEGGGSCKTKKNITFKKAAIVINGGIE